MQTIEAAVTEHMISSDILIVSQSNSNFVSIAVDPEASLQDLLVCVCVCVCVCACACACACACVCVSLNCSGVESSRKWKYSNKVPQTCN